MGYLVPIILIVGFLREQATGATADRRAPRHASSPAGYSTSATPNLKRSMASRSSVDRQSTLPRAW